MLLVLASVGALLVTGCSKAPSKQTVAVRIGTATLTCDVADTEEARQRGLQGHPALREGEGMIFVSQGPPRRVDIVMKSVSYPLDVIFVDARMRVARVAMLRPEPQRPNEVGSPGPVRYVIEAKAGWARRHRVGRGTRVVLPAGSL